MPATAAGRTRVLLRSTRAAKFWTTNRIYLLTTICVRATRFASSLIEGVVRRHPEGGARCGVLRRRLATAASGGRDPARQALRPGCEELAARIRKANARRCMASGAEGDGSAAPGEKSPRWSAERRASRVMGRKAPRKRLAYRVISAFTRVFDAHDTPHGCRCTRTFLGAPPTPRFGVSEATSQNPGAKMRRGNAMGCLTS